MKNDNRIATVETTGKVIQADFTAGQACDGCATRSLCLPPEGRGAANGKPWVDQWRPQKSGKYLFRQGENFKGVFFVRSGAVKVFRTLSNGEEQITGFHLAGDIFGLDGLQSDAYATSAVTLDTTAVCFLPKERLLSGRPDYKDIDQYVLGKAAEHINRQHGLSMILARNKAHERISAFLLDLSDRFARRKLSGTGFHLPMSRTDISRYLGLSLECVSRAFSRLEKTGVLACDGRDISILDRGELLALAGGDFETEQVAALSPVG